jgi:hypothetical protein
LTLTTYFGSQFSTTCKCTCKDITVALMLTLSAALQACTLLLFLEPTFWYVLRKGCTKFFPLKNVGT